MRSENCSYRFFGNALGNCDKHKKLDKREPGFFKEDLRCTQLLCLCSNTYCCYDIAFNNFKFGSEGLNKYVLENNGDGPLDKYRGVLDGKSNITSTNRDLLTNTHAVATYD